MLLWQLHVVSSFGTYLRTNKPNCLSVLWCGYWFLSRGMCYIWISSLITRVWEPWAYILYICQINTLYLSSKSRKWESNNVFMLLSFFLLLGFSMWTPFWHSRMSKKWTTYYSMWNLLHLFADSCSIFDCAVSIRRPLALHNIEIRCSKFKLSQLWVDKCPHKKKNTFSTLIFKLVLVLATGAQLLLYYIQH